MHLRFLTIWICLFIFLAEMQKGFAQQAMIRTYTMGDGLVMNRVSGFHQDATGFIWIYTWDGLSRLEGNRFRNYFIGKELTHSLANDMVEYEDGTIYVAFNDGTVEVIRDLEVQTHERIKGPIINSFFRDDDGKVFAATDNAGICSFDRGVTKLLLPADPGFGIYEVIPEKDDVFLYVSRDRQPSGVINTEMKFIKNWRGLFFECIYRDKNNKILVGTDNGLKEVNMDEGSEKKYSIQDLSFIPDDAPWKNWRVLAITQSNDGSYWIGTVNGLIRIGIDSHWTLLSKQDGLPSNFINSLFIDKSNTLWIGTTVGAASLNLVNTISQFNTNNDRRTYYFLPQGDGYMYCVVGYDHIYGINPQGKVISETVVKTTSDHLVSIINRNGEVLILQKSGVNKMPTIHSSEGVLSHTSMSTKYITECNNRIYFISNDDLIYCSSGTSCQLTTGFDHRTEAIATYGNNKLLLGTWWEGLFLASTLGSTQKCELHMEKNLTGWLPGIDIRSLMVSSNNDIWVGTRFNGLARLRCDAACDTCEVKVYTMLDGLMSNWITCMAEDVSGNIWVGSASGLDKLIPRKNGYRIFSYSRVFGFYGHIGHLAIGSDHAIWCGTSEGYARIIDSMQDTMPPSPVYITEANLGGIRQPNNNHSESVVLPYNHNSVNFTFAAPDYTNVKQLSFTYRLLGSQDTLWSSPGNHQQIFYGNLLPGSYKFEVAAIGLNGERGKSIAYPFDITPPFWRQFWFAGLVICAIALLLYSLHRFRIAQIEHVQMVRDRIASDLHDEIGSTLTHVNILSEFGLQSVDEIGKPADIFERIGTHMQSSAEALDDIIWSVKTRKDSIDDIIPRMRQYTTELFEPSGITFQISEENSSDQQLNMELRRDLYLAYKELLRNIVRHAGATHVDIHIRIDRRFVKLSIKDNGKGFDILAPSKRNGLNNIRKRVLNWHGNVEWNSKKGFGTEVKLEMKLH